MSASTFDTSNTALSEMKALQLDDAQAIYPSPAPNVPQTAFSDLVSAGDIGAACADGNSSPDILRDLHERFGSRMSAALALIGNPATPDDVIEALCTHRARLVSSAAWDVRTGRRHGINMSWVGYQNQAAGL